MNKSKIINFVLLNVTALNASLSSTMNIKNSQLENLDSVEMIKQKEDEQNNKTTSIVYEGFEGLTSNSTFEEASKEISKSNNDISLSLEFNSSYDGDTSRPDFDSDENEVDEIINQRRKEISDFYYNSNLENLSSLNIDNYENVFVSKYSPFVDINVDKDYFAENGTEMLSEMIENKDIETIYVREANKDDVSSNMESAFPSVGLPKPSDMNSFGYDGSGVTVGVLEAGGIVNVKHENISGSNVTTKGWYFFETKSEHALRVVSILGANTGVARKAKILSAKLSGDPKAEVEWMLDRNVNIINNSWGETNESLTGVYKSNSAYFDYISRLNWVTICASAGNAGDKIYKKTGKKIEWVGNPGLGYNVITVGASYDNKTLRPSSSFKEAFSISKPTLVAPGYDISVPTLEDTIIIDGEKKLQNCGTSFSAPIVSGTIALLMQEFPKLKTYPELVISILTSSASRMSTSYNNFDSSGLEDKVGSGKLDYNKAKEAYKNSFTFCNSCCNGKRSVKKENVYLTKGKTAKISLAWIVDSNNQTNTNIVTDYDLYLRNSKGNIVKYSSSGGNNIELIEFDVMESDTYTIEVYQYGNKKGSRTDFGAVSYTIF